MNLSKRYKYFIVIFVVLFGLSDYYHAHIAPKAALAAHFEGPVDSIYYDAKGNSYVYIKRKKRDLYYMTWHRSCLIHKGDVLIKIKGDLRLRLVRQNQTDTIFFNDND